MRIKWCNQHCLIIPQGLVNFSLVRSVSLHGWQIIVNVILFSPKLMGYVFCCLIAVDEIKDEKIKKMTAIN